MNTQNAYLPYGYHLPDQRVLGFNGERLDPVTEHYLLGNGYRAFNPSLMRFNSPDSLSPFAEGGVNAYVYCQGDPVDYQDPSGHSFWRMLAGVVKTPKRKAITAIVNEGQFTQVVGWHGTSRKNKPSLFRGLSSGHSEVHRQAQGRGFYVAPTPEHAKRYADLYDDGIVLPVVSRKDARLVPGVGYKKDVFDVVVITEAAFDVVRVREAVPSGATPAALPRTGIFARKPAPAA
jgi:RHS repeat-associated protein